MKYLLVAHYAGFDLDDPEDFVNRSWLVGEVETDEQAVELATKEISDYVEEQVSAWGYQGDDEDDVQEAEDFRNEFEISIANSINQNEKMETIASLHYASDYYFEDLKFELIKLN